MGYMNEKRKEISKSNRYIICCSDPFPFGTANSNYIRNMALALKNVGKDVLVIGLIENINVPDSEEKGSFEGIDYINITQKKSKIPFRLTNHLFFGKKIVKCLRKQKVKQEDYIIVYTDYISVSKSLFKTYAQNNKIGHMAYCIVEWFQAHQYTGGKLSLDYIFWKFHFDFYMPQYKKVIGISTKLARHFSEMGCQTMVLPCLTDCNSVKISCDLSKNKKKVYDFIYPGAATNKDSLEGMLKGLLLLTESEQQQIRFHLTTLKPNKLIEAAECSEKVLSQLSDVLVFHGRLEYAELLALYQKVDYLFLAREKNIITESNFPSKVPEMLAYGVIPVCSNVGDYTKLYLKDDVNAIVFEGATPEACSQAYRRAINVDMEKKRYMRISARHVAETKLDYHVWGEKLALFLGQSL